MRDLFQNTFRYLFVYLLILALFVSVVGYVFVFGFLALLRAVQTPQR